jgi:hypothetical protein
VQCERASFSLREDTGIVVGLDERARSYLK